MVVHTFRSVCIISASAAVACLGGLSHPCKFQQLSEIVEGYPGAEAQVAHELEDS
jgi:hypothetical protein